MERGRMTNKTDAEIIANVPEGATHHVIDNGTNYSFKIEDEQAFVWVGRWEYYIHQKYCLPDLYNIRNVNDIRENIALQERIAELEKGLELAVPVLNSAYKQHWDGAFNAWDICNNLIKEKNHD
jgi:hypothetical protein